MLTHTATLYLATILIWGTTWFAITFQLGLVAEEVSLAYRFLLASAILLVFCKATGRSLRFRFIEHSYIAWQGLFLFSLNYLLFYWATNTLASGLVAVGFSTVICMNIIGVAIVFKQKITASILVGATLGLIGIAMIFLPEISDFSLNGDGVRGLAWCLLATVFASIGNILSAYNQKRGLPIIQTNALGMGYGSLVMVLYAFARGIDFRFDTSASYLFSLLYLSVFGSIFAFGAYLTLIGRIGADKTAYTAVVFPVVALTISTLFEGYRWSLVAFIGLLLVFVGNVLVLRRSPSAKVNTVIAK